MSSALRPSLAALAALASTACHLERLYPEEIGAGVARLTVRNAATIVALLDRDEACGFANAEVRAAAAVEGEIGGPGRATWTVTDCVIDLGAMHELATDCSGTKTSAGGRVTVSASRTVEGHVTGNPGNPVVPLTPDAATIHFEAKLGGFEVRSSASTKAIRFAGGTLSWTARPHLAVSASKGACAVGTNDLSLDDLVFEDGALLLDTGEDQYEVDVPTSKLAAQIGRWGERENWLSGSLTVWDSPVTLPAPEDSDELEPDYDAAKFRASWECKPDLARPVSYECPPLGGRVAQGAAQFTVVTFGRLADAVDRDTSCGFSSPVVFQNPELTGTVGERGASATFLLAQPCTLKYATKTPIYEDCHGVVTYAQGTVRVSGTKVVRGIRTGSPAAPIVPTSRDPAELRLQMEFDDLVISDSRGRALTMKEGGLSGRSLPRTALDTSTGACSQKTPVARFEDLAWTRAKLLLTTDGNSFGLDVSDSKLLAVNGTVGSLTNHLSGSLTIGGEAVDIPAGGGAPLLDPAYEAARFDASYSCRPNLEIAASDEECAFRRPLAEAAARLVVQATGSVASQVNANDECGFEDTWVKLRPDRVEGDAGELGLMSWKVDDCAIGGMERIVSRGCTGGKTYFAGYATVDARRTVTGLREKKLLVVDSIVPTSRESVTIELTDVSFDEAVSFSIAPGATDAAGRLTIHSGRLVATVRPILGENANTPGVFDVKTPVTQLSDIVLTNARATLESAGKTFKLYLPEMRLSAFNGSYAGHGNELTGTAKVGDVPIDLGNLPLDPAFDQATFDASYECTPDLDALIPPT